MTISLVSPATGDTYRRGLQLATVEYRAERWSDALRLYEWVLPYAEQQDAENVCGLRNNIASCLYHLGRLDESVESCRSLILFARASIGDDAAVIGKCEKRIKNCEREMNARRSSRLWADALECYRRKDYRGAIKRWTECLKYHQELGDQRWQTMRFLNLSICRFGLKQYVNAFALMTQAQGLVDAGSLTDDDDKELFAWHAQRVRIGFESMEALALLEEYEVHCDNEDWARAEDAAFAAMVEMERSCRVKLDCFIGAKVLNAVAFTCYKQERYAEARSYWQQALRPAQKWAAKEQSDLPDRIKGCMKWCDMH
ncbi:MAG: hypothetical protein K2W95_22050 [Candidatus Obscuribacterales bacterium]|nr:hypothetical protein [Candidatus Obscuribacterales bacterium]